MIEESYQLAVFTFANTGKNDHVENSLVPESARDRNDDWISILDSMRIGSLRIACANVGFRC